MEPRNPPRTVTPGRIVAHRGASRVAPENTEAAFRAAARLGARWVECDISLLGDGAAVIHHDLAFGRTNDGRGPLSAAVRADLKAIDAGAWFGPDFVGERVIELGAALDLFDGLGLSANLELKTHEAEGPALAETVAAALTARPGAAARFIISSFDHETLAAFRRLAPAQPVAMLWEQPPLDWTDTVVDLDGASMHCEWTFVDNQLLERAVENDIEVRVYTINDPAPMRPFLHRGLTGVITDHPPIFLDDPEWRAWAATP